MDNTFISGLNRLANQLLKQEKEQNKDYLIKEIYDKVSVAAEESPEDQSIIAAQFILQKKFEKNPIQLLSRAQLNDLYNDVIGLRTNSRLKMVLAEYIDDPLRKEATEGEAEFVRGNRHSEPIEFSVDSTLQHNLNGAFDDTIHVINYDKEQEEGGAKAVELELASMGIKDFDVRASGGDSTGILYTVGFMTNMGQRTIGIPVHIKDDKCCLPSNFVSSGKTYSLTRENLANELDKLSKTAAEGHHIDSIDVPQQEIPEELQELAPSIDDILFETQLNFPIETIRHAKSAVRNELFGLGIVPKKVVATHSVEDGILCKADMNTPNGHVSINIPVEIVQDHPISPSFFVANNKTLGLTKENIDALAMEGCQDNLELFSRSSLNDLGYGELRDLIVTAAQKKAYSQCEEALGVIANKFGDECHADSMRQYSNILVAMSPNAVGDKEEVIKDAKRENMEGVLISTNKVNIEWT